MRPSRRQPDELRAISLERGVVKYAEGSCFVKFGDTQVLVTATLEDRLPPWLKGQARGWVTAEYGMLPRATLERTRREASAGKQKGRTVEIQRLIGAQSAHHRRPAGARRAPDHDRLRRHPGRRRHPHRRHHRRLGGAARLHRLDEDPRHAQGRAAARSRRGDLVRHLPGHAGARSRLCGRLRGRHRRELRADRRRPHRRGAGHRREEFRSPRSSSSNFSRSPRRASPSWSICRSSP